MKFLKKSIRDTPINRNLLGFTLNLSILISESYNKNEVRSTGEGNGLKPVKYIVVIHIVTVIVDNVCWEALKSE